LIADFVGSDQEKKALAEFRSARGQRSFVRRLAEKLGLAAGK
jgi:hypothetical protein